MKRSFGWMMSLCLALTSFLSHANAGGKMLNLGTVEFNTLSGRKGFTSNWSYLWKGVTAEPFCITSTTEALLANAKQTALTDCQNGGYKCYLALQSQLVFNGPVVGGFVCIVRSFAYRY